LHSLKIYPTICTEKCQLLISLFSSCFSIDVITDTNGLIFIGNMLATCFSNLRWRPVVAVLVGTILYIVSLPLATAAQKVYLDSINTFTTDHVPIMGALLMLVATIVSLRSTSSVDFIEFAAKIRLSYRIQSYVFVEYNAVLPLVLFVNRYYTHSYCYVSVNLL